jgi:hypothetical protein
MVLMISRKTAHSTENFKFATEPIDTFYESGKRHKNGRRVDESQKQG